MSLIGYAFCGSYCTHKRSLDAMFSLLSHGYEIVPIMSEHVYATDTRFGQAKDLIAAVESACGRPVIHTIVGAEPLGPKIPLDALVIASCTGNTLSKIAHGITDTAVTMAAKAELRGNRPVVLSLATNDALSGSLGSIALLLERKHIYFVPMLQDDPVHKPHSLIADTALIESALEGALKGQQMQPIFLPAASLSLSSGGKMHPEGETV